MTDEFDVAVIGGGITGVAIAEKIVARGLRVGLFDAASLGSATSASSHCIIHGGFRYLTKLDFARVRESVSNLDSCLSRFGDIVQPLPCYMPLRRWGLKSELPVRCAGLLYEVLRLGSAARNGGGSVAKGEDVPEILRPAPCGALRWVDGWLRDHDGIIRFLAGKIREGGGGIRENCRISEIARDDRYFHFRSADQKFSTRCMVTALGPWAVAGPLARFGTARRALAYNVVVRRNLQEYTQSRLCGVARESPAGRLFFLVPRVDGVAIGTGYVEAGSDETFSAPPMEEIRRFLHDSRGLFNWPELSEDEIVRVEWGALPVRAMSSGGPEFYGSSLVTESEPGRFDVLSTKYTSFESTARQVERMVMSRLK